MSSSFEDELERALMLIRDLRLRAVLENIDARALRVALKFALMVDDYLAREKLSREEDAELTRIAEELFKISVKQDRLHV
jgi:hypothetical protein